MSVAVVINKKAVANGLPEGGDEKLLAAKLAEIEGIVRSASGVMDSRGDVVKISAIDFFVDDVPLCCCRGTGGQLLPCWEPRNDHQCGQLDCRLVCRGVLGLCVQH